MPFLLNDVTLDTSQLASFLRFLKSHPSAGEHTRSVTFALDTLNQSIPRIVAEPFMECLGIRYGLPPLEKKFAAKISGLAEGKMPVTSEESSRLSNYLSHVKGVILNAMPRVWSLQTNYIAGFPLRSINSPSYLSSLETLSLKSQASNLPQRSARNFIRILLFLPSLEDN